MHKSSALTIITWTTTAFCIYILCNIKEVRSQTVYLDPSSMGNVSSCQSGLRDGIDFYVFRGIVNATIEKYSNLIDFQIKPNSSNTFSYLCTASLVTCITPNPQPCYCAKQNGSIYEIVANRTAVIGDNNATIRIHWDSSSGSNVDSNQLQVPTIYDVNAVITTLTLEDTPFICPGNVTYGSVITFKCEEKSPRPCEVTISLNSTEVVKSEHKATYTVTTDLSSNSTHSFTFSYSVCGGAIISKTCIVNIDITSNLTDSAVAKNSTDSTDYTYTTKTNAPMLVTDALGSISTAPLITTSNSPEKTPISEEKEEVSLNTLNKNGSSLINISVFSILSLCAFKELVLFM